MSSNNSGSNKLVIPEARQAMDQFKMEAANEVGVNLKQGYNGDLTAQQAGSIGGQMVKKMNSIRPTKAMCFERASRTAEGHCVTVKYIAGLVA
ncbi:MAG: alpha/beta-type small acid-soluble spore protein [Clostridiales bacterium]|nr:alpha/beta-type small acid-soluble spore protein [Clostridiales bacterium]